MITGHLKLTDRLNSRVFAELFSAELLLKRLELLQNGEIFLFCHSCLLIAISHKIGQFLLRSHVIFGNLDQFLMHQSVILLLFCLLEAKYDAK